MVQLRGRTIPFGRSAAEQIGDAGHGMKATSGSGRPTADPCLRAAGSLQRPFSVGLNEYYEVGGAVPPSVPVVPVPVPVS